MQDSVCGFEKGKNYELFCFSWVASDTFKLFSWTRVLYIPGWPLTSCSTKHGLGVLVFPSTFWGWNYRHVPLPWFIKCWRLQCRAPCILGKLSSSGAINPARQWVYTEAQGELQVSAVQESSKVGIKYSRFSVSSRWGESTVKTNG